MAPTKPPRRNMAIAADQTFGTSVRARSRGDRMTAVAFATLSEPTRAMKPPAIGISTSEPRPKPRIKRPRTPSPIASRSLNSGILGAQLPVTKPFIRKSSDTASRLLDM
jgi:hypothetical protein